MKILNFGSLNLDYVYQVDHMVMPGETLASENLKIYCGGKGLNQSIALVKAGAGVFHAGCIGEEGGLLLDELARYGVNADLVKRLSGKSGHTVIQVDKTGQNCILLYGGANRAVTTDYVDAVLENFQKGDLLLLQNEINLLDYIIEAAWKKGMTIVLNPSPYDDHLESCDLGKISMFLINEVEGAQMTGKTEPEDILDALRVLYPEADVVLTLGADGAFCQSGSRRYRQTAYKTEAVDTTAAGDTFTGYFLTAITEGLEIQTALELASAAAAISVTRPGAAPSIPTREETEQFTK